MKRLPSQSPCFKCEERSVGCHAECERYNSWKQQLKVAKERQVDAYQEYNGYSVAKAIKKKKGREL